MATPKFYVKASSYSNINPYPTWKRDADYWEKDLSNNLFYMSGNIGIGYPIPAGGFVVNTTIGIGTSAPQAALDVSGNVYLRDGTAATPILTFNTDTNTGFYRPGNDTLGFVTGGIERMRIDASGNTSFTGNVSTSANIGIGTITPRAKFDVNDTGAMIIPTGTTVQQPTVPVVGMLRYNIDTGRIQFYNPFGWSSLGGVNAMGGTLTETGGYRIHTFTSSGTFTINLGGTVEYLIIAGGGGGGYDAGGGGGGGGLLMGSMNTTSSSYEIVIGGGGAFTSAPATQASKGGNSSLGSFSAEGGGGAGSKQSNGMAGGSGGGGGHPGNTGGNGNTGPPRQGYNGGNGASIGGGGGGGGGGIGQNGGSTRGGDGGSGLLTMINNSVYYAGGGGGGNYTGDNFGGAGGLGGGGGGKGKVGVINGSSVDGTINTGGGGGGLGNGSSSYGNAGNGGSGIVIIRYLL